MLNLNVLYFNAKNQKAENNYLLLFVALIGKAKKCVITSFIKNV